MTFQHRENYYYLVKKIGEIFKKYRDNAKLSMRDIYRDEKISIATISDMETGKKLPRVETLLNLIYKVGMPLNKVFSNDVLPNNYNGVQFGIPQKLNWKQVIKNDLIENKFLPNEIDEILRYIEYIKANRFNNKKL